MTKDEAIQQIITLLPVALGADVVVVSRETISEIISGVEELESEIDTISSNVGEIESEISDLQYIVSRIENAANDTSVRDAEHSVISLLEALRQL
jgi:prefoldin subunit 5